VSVMPEENGALGRRWSLNLRENQYLQTKRKSKYIIPFSFHQLSVFCFLFQVDAIRFCPNSANVAILIIIYNCGYLRKTAYMLLGGESKRDGWSCNGLNNMKGIYLVTPRISGTSPGSRILRRIASEHVRTGRPDQGTDQ
jgi:hypothetical protein